MRLRRCPALLIEPRERRQLDLAGVLAGEAKWDSDFEWVALTAHQDGEVVLTQAELQVLGGVSADSWVLRDELVRSFGADVIDALAAKGLLLDETADGCGGDPAYWHPLAAVAHRQLRWRGTDTGQAQRLIRDAGDSRTTLDRLGPPPPAAIERGSDGIALPEPTEDGAGLARLLSRRTTCRNFDTGRNLSLPVLATVLKRVYGAEAVSEVTGVTMLKKGTPSAGGLHPVEAYLLIRRVDGLRPGLYHYHPVAHALEPIRQLDDAESGRLAGVFVAQQSWFVEAPVQVILAGRFRRNFWKYRQHAKAYRAVILDAGHLSQTQYLIATELGLAAFITAAVNEGDIEDAFGLDPMVEGVIAVTGFGHRGQSMDQFEFDPRHAVWPPPSA